MTFDAGPGGFGPDAQPGIGSVTALLGKGLRNVSYGQGTRPEFDEPRRPLRRVRRCKFQRVRQGVDGVAELFPGDGIRPPRFYDLAQCFSQELDRVFQSRERTVSETRFLDKLPAAVGEGQQMPSKVSAVHGGDILRIQGVKIASVIPVIEVPSNRSEERRVGKECRSRW